jgi:hypothetical protein
LDPSRNSVRNATKKQGKAGGARDELLGKAGSRKQGAGSREEEAGRRKQKAGSREEEADLEMRDD